MLVPRDEHEGQQQARSGARLSLEHKPSCRERSQEATQALWKSPEERVDSPHQSQVIYILGAWFGSLQVVTEPWFFDFEVKYLIHVLIL